MVFPKQGFLVGVEIEIEEISGMSAENDQAPSDISRREVLLTL